MSFGAKCIKTKENYSKATEVNFVDDSFTVYLLQVKIWAKNSTAQVNLNFNNYLFWPMCK